VEKVPADIRKGEVDDNPTSADRYMERPANEVQVG